MLGQIGYDAPRYIRRNVTMDIRQPATHLDHLIRQTRVHHVQLSAMADMKANMMLTVASLLIPLSIHFFDHPHLKFPALVMIGFCVLTVVLAAYAAMPKISKQSHLEKNQMVGQPSFNLLFFGSFLTLNYTEYAAAMEELMNDHEKAYEIQIREIYSMGHYLAFKKYRFVRFAYLSFISGVLISSIFYVFHTSTLLIP